MRQLTAPPLRNPRTVTRRTSSLPNTPEFAAAHARIRACGLTGLEAAALILWSDGLNCRSMARRLARSERATWAALRSGCDRLLLRSRREARLVVLCFRSGSAWDGEGEPITLRRSLVDASDLTAELEKVSMGV